MNSKWLNTSEIIEKNAKKPCHRLGWCPYGKLVEEFPLREQISEISCKVFQHDCPIFYHIEYTSEEFIKEDYEREIENLYDLGGLSEIFSKDKIAEYWYNIGFTRIYNMPSLLSLNLKKYKSHLNFKPIIFKLLKKF